MTSKTLNVAMIGYSFMGRAHTQAWRNAPLYFDVDAGAGLKVVCGRSEEPLKSFADRWGWQETETDWRRAVTREDIDIVDISTPTALHAEIAIAAAQAGKHIFCEKPFAMNSRQAADMLAVARESGRSLMISNVQRYAMRSRKLKEQIDSGTLGDVYYIKAGILQPL